MPKKPVHLWLFIAVAVGLLAASLNHANLLWPVAILLACALFLFVSHRLYNLVNWIDPVVMFIVSYVAFVIAGIIGARYFNVDIHTVTMTAVMLGLAAFLAGAFFADLLASPHNKLRLKHVVTVNSAFNRHEIRWAWIFFLIGLSLLLAYYAIVGTIPFLAENAETVRVEAKKGIGYILISGFAFLNVSTILLMAINARRHQMRLFLTMGIVLSITVALLVGIGYRMPAVRVMLGAFIVYHFIRYANIPKRNLGVLIFTLIILLGAAGFYRLSGQFVQSTADLEFAFRRAVWSLFVRYLYVLDLTIDFFPKEHAFLYGNSYLISARTLLPGAQQHFGYWLVEKLGLILSSPGPVDPTIVGEFYVNFGWIGVVLGMGGSGFFLRALYRYLVHSSVLSVTRLILITLISTSIIGVTASGIILVLLFDLLPIIVVFALYQLCVRLRVSKPRRSVLTKAIKA